MSKHLAFDRDWTKRKKKMFRGAYIFLFQVQEVIDGFIHVFRTTYYCHKVWVCSATLWKPEVNLKT